MSVRSLRPWQIFELVPAVDHRRLASMYLPKRDSVMLALETLCLLSMVKHLEPRRIFEFGTFRGETTLCLAANAGDGARVFTLDLDERHLGEVRFDDFDEKLARLAVRGEPVFAGTPLEARITRLFGDSMTYDYGALRQSMDFVFVDGNHAVDYVRSDTERALEMLADDGWLVWHDYGPLAIRMAERAGADVTTYEELTRYVDGVAETRPVFRVEDTRLAFTVRGTPPAF